MYSVSMRSRLEEREDGALLRTVCGWNQDLLVVRARCSDLVYSREESVFKDQGKNFYCIISEIC